MTVVDAAFDFASLFTSLVDMIGVFKGMGGASKSVVTMWGECFIILPMSTFPGPTGSVTYCSTPHQLSYTQKNFLDNIWQDK
jgi:hypothetical protein